VRCARQRPAIETEANNPCLKNIKNLEDMRKIKLRKYTSWKNHCKTSGNTKQQKL
jgi:hypothetical protein